MATIKRFEELEIWKEARLLCISIRTISNKPTFAKDYSLKNQILGSSGSVMDNIAEGYERDGMKEFLNFLYIAKGSLGEVRSQVYRSFDSGYIDQNEFNKLINNCLTLSSKIQNFIKYLRSTTYEGHKKTNL